MIRRLLKFIFCAFIIVLLFPAACIATLLEAMAFIPIVYIIKGKWIYGDLQPAVYRLFIWVSELVEEE